MDTKVYVPGQDRKADDLVKLFDKLNLSAVADRNESVKERPANDPLGLSRAEEKPREDYETAMEAAVCFTKWFGHVVHDYNLSPRAAIFMAELTFLNIVNADNIPIGPEEVREVREAAFKYYAENRERVPDGPESRF